MTSDCHVQFFGKGLDTYFQAHAAWTFPRGLVDHKKHSNAAMTLFNKNLVKSIKKNIYIYIYIYIWCSSINQWWRARWWEPNLCSLPWLVKGATQLWTSKKEWNKLDLNCSSVFLIGSIIRIGPGGLLLVVFTYMQFYWWGCQKKKAAQLRRLILLSRVTY
jgi:hypothetical protein